MGLEPDPPPPPAALRVAAAVIEADVPVAVASCLADHPWAPGRILIARRRPELRQGGRWELPGGKIEAGETAAECLRREIREELGIAVQVGGYVGTHVHDYGRGPIALEAWRCTWESGHLTPTDHDAFAWVSPREMLAFALAAADVPLAEALVRMDTG